MSSPRPSVFIAYPLSTARDPRETGRLVKLFRDVFVSGGWEVNPRRGESIEALNDRLRSGGGASLVARNIEGIVTSDLLLVIAAEMDEPSSVWVEAGVALARGIPLIVVAISAVSLPFLIRAAVTHTAITSVNYSSFPLHAYSTYSLATEDHQAQAIHDLIRSI